jgi:hypothetical protein
MLFLFLFFQQIFQLNFQKVNQWQSLLNVVMDVHHDNHDNQQEEFDLHHQQLWHNVVRYHYLEFSTKSKTFFSFSNENLLNLK